MPERKTVTIPLGPMYTRGDLVKSPEGATPKARNCVFRRGVVEKRPGFLRESDASVPTNSAPLYIFPGSSATYLVAGGITDGTAEYRNSNGTWTAMSANAGVNAVEYNNSLYMLGLGGSATQSRVDSFDGSTVATTITTTRIGGAAMTQMNGRLVIGSPRFYYANGGWFMFAFNSAPEWTVGGTWVQPTGATVRLATVAHATNDTITSTAAVYTTGAADGYVTAVFEIQAVHATSTVPIKVSLQNAAGTTTYGLKQYVVSSATDDPEWRQYYVTAYCPASTAIHAKLQCGNDTGGATVGVTFRLSDSGDNHGFSVYPGKFVYPYGAQVTYTPTLGGIGYANRIYWSEALDFADWRNESFSEVDESPGSVTALAGVNNRLVVFKREAMWVYRYGESALLPFIRDTFIPGIGALSQRAVAAIEGVLFFVSGNEVYAFDGASEPKPLCGEAMRDEIFSDQVDSAVIAVDTDNREVWVAARDYRIYIFSIEQMVWIGYYQLTDSAASETPFTPYGRITGMVHGKPQGETYREMWLTFDTGTNATTVCKLRNNQTLDNLDGTERDVVAEYVLHPLESGRPRKPITVQGVGIDHKITGTQAASTTEYSFSVDGGNTFSKYNQVRLPTSTGASTDTDPIRVPLHQTAPRIVLKIKHTGAAGPTYFNMTGAEASIIVRGREVQASNPTAVGSSL